MQAKFLVDYSDILFNKTIALPDRNETYVEIRFDKFIERLFPNQEKFIESSSFGDISKKLSEKYGNDNDCFETMGVLETILINKLKFYQPNVGVNGPKHSELEQPVYILKYSDSLLLYNGYHRLFAKMLKKETEIEGYILTFD